MRTIVLSTQYKKDLSLAVRRGLPVNELDELVKLLAEDKQLPAKCHDHSLSGQFSSCRECHVRPDWLLIYRKSSATGVELLSLLRTGTHDELFGKLKR